MATSVATTFGKTPCHIDTRFHVDIGHVGDHPAVATAFANDEPVTDERGQPVEYVATTEEQAAANMRSYLEKRFGARA
jgi:hypothetical protein